MGFSSAVYADDDTDPTHESAPVAPARKSSMAVPTIMSWSGGKDSALALAALLSDPMYDVRALLTTVTRDFDRIAMHGVRRDLLHAQAVAIGIPLVEVWIDAGAGNAEYEQAMSAEFQSFREAGTKTVAFGDLFLEDVRAYRETLVGRLDMKPIFPLWGRDTTDLARDFVDRGFRARTCCVDTNVLDRSFCGRDLSHRFLDELPQSIDPCAENGEFHTFVYDAPFFSQPINVETGPWHEFERFVYRDLLQAEA